MNNASGRSQSIFTVVLYLIFVMLTFMLLVTGAALYGKLTDSMNDNYDMRTALSYVSTKVRQCDGGDNIATAVKDGQTALVLKEQAEEATLETWIYFYDGALREIYIEQGTDFDLRDGEELLRLKSMEIRQIQGGIAVKAENNGGRSEEIILAKRK